MLYADTPPKELARYAGFLMNFLGQRAGARFVAALEPHGVHPRQFGVMNVLAANPGLTQQELAETSHVDPSTMVALLDALEGRGLAVRTVHAGDRRKRIVALTAEGEQLLARLREEATRTSAATLAPLDAAERAELLRLLQKLAGLAPG